MGDYRDTTIAARARVDGATESGMVSTASARLTWLLPPASPVALAQIELEHYGACAGIAWPAGTTLREYGELVAVFLRDPGPLRELVSLIEQARYGGRGLNIDEQRRLRTARERVRAQLRRWWRWRSEEWEGMRGDSPTLIPYSRF